MVSTEWCRANGVYQIVSHTWYPHLTLSTLLEFRHNEDGNAYTNLYVCHMMIPDLCICKLIIFANFATNFAKLATKVRLGSLYIFLYLPHGPVLSFIYCVTYIYFIMNYIYILHNLHLFHYCLLCKGKMFCV